MPLIIDGSNNTISASPSANVVFVGNVVFSNAVSFGTGGITANGSTGSAGQALFSSGTGSYWATISASGQVVNTRFLSSGTSYTTPSNVTRILVEAVGGGGGGAYIEGYLTAAQIGTSQTYFVGAGGAGVSAPAGCTRSCGNAGSNTTFGSIFVAGAGGAGISQVFLPTGPVCGTYGGLVTSLYSGNYFGKAGNPSSAAPNNTASCGGTSGNPGIFGSTSTYGAGSAGAKGCGSAVSSNPGTQGYIYMIEYY